MPDVRREFLRDAEHFVPGPQAPAQASGQAWGHRSSPAIQACDIRGLCKTGKDGT